MVWRGFSCLVLLGIHAVIYQQVFEIDSVQLWYSWGVCASRCICIYISLVGVGWCIVWGPSPSPVSPCRSPRYRHRHPFFSLRPGLKHYGPWLWVGGRLRGYHAVLPVTFFSIQLCRISLPMAINSSTYNSSSLTRPSKCLFTSFLVILWNITSSNLWGGSFINCSLYMRSRAVSDPEQKNGGLLHQPIWSLFGTTTSTSSIDSQYVNDGRT